MVIVRLRAMLSVCLRAMPRPLGMPMLLLPRIHHLNRPRSFWLRLCKPLRLLWQRNRLRYLAQLLRPRQTKANPRRPLARPVRWPLGVPSLLSSQATAFAASGAGFAAHSTSAGASAAQGRPAFVVPTFVSTFLPPNPSHSLSIANMATTSSLESVSSAATLPQANISSATSFPVLNQPFIVGPGFSPVPAKVVGQVVAGKFIDLGDLLPSTVASAEPEPQLLFDGRLVLTSTPKKPKRRVEDIATWMEAFSVYCLIMISFFLHRSRDLLQYKLLILRTYRQFSGKVWLAYDRAFREHAAAANVVDWSSINVQPFNFHAAGALARGPNVSSTDSSEPVGASASQILCKSWNKGRCVAPYASCRFVHRCSSCSGAHRAVNCPGSEPAQPPVKSSRRSRSPSRSSSKSRRT